MNAGLLNRYRTIALSHYIGCCETSSSNGTGARGWNLEPHKRPIPACLTGAEKSTGTFAWVSLRSRAILLIRRATGQVWGPRGLPGSEWSTPSETRYGEVRSKSMGQTVCRSWLIFGFVAAGYVICGGHLAALPASGTETPPSTRLYVFGDSYSDTGAGYLDGNGPTAVAYLAGHLGFALVPSNASDTTGKSLNFAVSGAGTGSGSGKRIKGALLGLGMRNQVEDFAARVHAGSVHFQPETTLFFIAGGLNDERLATATTVENLKTEVRILYGLGGRRFLIALLPISIPGFSDVSKRLNPALARIPRELAAELPDASIGLSHWGVFFDDVMHEPAKYGITNTSDACAGRAIFNEDPTPCSKPESYFYYHAEHPSTAVQKVVGKKLYEEVLRLPPPPSAGKTKTSN